MKTGLSEWKKLLRKTEIKFNRYYWKGKFVQAHYIQIFYMDLLSAVKKSYPEYRHR